MDMRPGYAIRCLSLILRALLFILVVIIILNAHYYSDYQTTLLPGVYIKDGMQDLKAGDWSVPIVYDWDNDGKKDLLVGQRYDDERKISHGLVTFYRNIGTDSEPMFNGSVKLLSCADYCSPLNAAAVG